MENPRQAEPERRDAMAPITEQQLARLWQRRAARSQALRAESGSRLRVLYPGRPGVTAGPDFRNALLAVEDQGLVQGDVEIHLRQQDWQAHGHQTDPRYNGVALHVALRLGGGPTRTDGGGTPLLLKPDWILDAELPRQGREDETRQALWALLARRGYRRPATAEQMTGLLNRAGDQRFLWRSRGMQLLMSNQSAEQTLWESICEALGYRHNQHAFLLLAMSAPVEILTGAASRLPEDSREQAVRDWLLRLAGFDAGVSDARRQRRPKGLGPPIDQRQWNLFRVRPPNHPKQRVKGAAALVARYCGPGLTAGFINVVAEGKVARVTRALEVKPDPGSRAALIGAARARDIAVNAALPYVHGWLMLRGDMTGAALALDLYRDCGPLGDNEITRELARTLQEPAWGKIANNARRQQGLIHLQRLLAGATPD